MRAYFSRFIEFPAAGTYAYFFVLPAPAPLLLMEPFIAPNLTVAEFSACCSHGWMSLQRWE
jgi:hypothetical protein